MIVINKASVAFEIPEEYGYAIKFQTEHPDWKRIEDSKFICFEKYYSYHTAIEGDEHDG